MIGDSVEGGIGVHMGGWIHQGSRSALDLCIVALPRHVLGDLFHVRFPIDLGVCKSHESRSASSAHFVAEGRPSTALLTGHLPDDQGAKDSVQDEESEGNEIGQDMAPGCDIADKSHGLGDNAGLSFGHVG